MLNLFWGNYYVLKKWCSHIVRYTLVITENILDSGIALPCMKSAIFFFCITSSDIRKHIYSQYIYTPAAAAVVTYDGVYMSVEWIHVYIGGGGD